MMNYEWCRPCVLEGDPPPALPPRAGRELAPYVSELARAEWYWGNISREDESEKLSGQPDGTFLVRDSHTASGEYTLCLNKGGVIRRIRIYCHDGYYGFSAELSQFESVVQLIDRYRRQSLREFNVNMDVRLERPLVEPRKYSDDVSITSLIDQLRDTYAMYDMVVGDLEQLDRRSSTLATSIVMHKKAQEAYEIVLGMFYEQVCLAQHIKAELHERDQVRENGQQLSARVLQVKQRQCQVDEEIHQQTTALKSAESKLGAAHQEERHLLQRKHDLERELLRHGINRERREKLLEGCVGGPTSSDCTPLSEQEQLWLLEDYDRPSAETLLWDKPDGTFLIRPHVQVPPNPQVPYTLSIKSFGKPRHCVIYRSDRGYGFSMPYAIHSSLKSLVDYYNAGNELSTFNEELPERLMYPVRGIRAG